VLVARHGACGTGQSNMEDIKRSSVSTPNSIFMSTGKQDDLAGLSNTLRDIDAWLLFQSGRQSVDLTRAHFWTLRFYPLL
jgi:hypothetical protein